MPTDNETALHDDRGYLPSQTPTRGDNQSKRRRRSASTDKTKNHRGSCGFYERANVLRHTGLSPSVPTKLADGLGLKDTPLASRDAPRSLVPPFSLGEERLGRQLFNFLQSIYHNYGIVSSQILSQILNLFSLHSPDSLAGGWPIARRFLSQPLAEAPLCAGAQALNIGDVNEDDDQAADRHNQKITPGHIAVERKE